MYAHHMPETNWLDTRESSAWRGFMAMQAQVRRQVAQRVEHDAGVSEADNSEACTPDEGERPDD